MKLIIGLGNPGNAYERTRHNAGFLAVNALAADMDVPWKEDKKRNVEVLKDVIGGTDVVLAKPTTFMNLSGDAVQALLSFYKVMPQDLLVVHDDMDLVPGTLRFKFGGGDAGNNGVASVIERLGTDAFARLRLGIGRPTDPQGPSSADYVLGTLSPEDSPNALDVVAAMRDWIESGTEITMNTWNKR